MKKVLLIGDSIRLGYDKYVKLALKEKAEVIYPTENCRSSAYVLRSMFFWNEWLKLDEDIDVIHWNAGLWDCLRLLDGKHLIPLDQYKENIERICFHFKKWFPKAKIIFATSTPVQEELFGECKRLNKDIEMYNDVACKIVKGQGGYIDDLYTVMNNYPISYHSDGTHYYTKEGTEVITNAVLESICEQLNTAVPKLDFDKCYNPVDGFLGL